MSASVSLENVQKRYGDVEVLKGLSLHIPAGQTVALIGPSGSGKSTLLRLLMTLERPDGGRILIDGESMWTEPRNGGEVPARDSHVRKLRGKIGMVFQHFNLFPHMTALRNVAEAPRYVLGLGREEAEQRAREYLEMVGLGDKLDQYPGNLSGGQKQRVGIARALAMRPEVMLFDEVTSALDPELVGGILEIMRDLSARRTMTMIIVTHQMRFAERCSDRTLFFEAGQILEDGPSREVFANPKHPRTRQFLDAVIDA
ncbi:ectoine/hydroxyectoine ABC transporter ATP-binding protein EhuA [Pigmentiphaga sp.]|uniref:ectoine/hydroxyectoine ABC transporter ATP-binding protein EhuA n=1 Tax=Pigmentiphaga sp. TaxID=1977564 RepID=UPI0025E2BE1D|nr:ectoine/hydroxyectoine ABC transporter ATP-binding protein EhuA [Pigmentiphaga sp.]MBX6319551.1 ectoine/hydroxyectoine ABC transporter ATP-binding protein EhuA [Pigmentiphaga sp.]